MHSWRHCIERALDKQLYRSIHLGRTNSDYRLRFPNEVKSNPEGKVLSSPNLEAKKRILHEHEVRVRNNIVPTVDRPKRFNRVA